MDALSEIIDLLEIQKINGIKYHEISEENLDFIRGKVTKGPALTDDKLEKQNEPRSETEIKSIKPNHAVLSSQSCVNIPYPDLAEQIKSCQKCSFCTASKHRLIGTGNLNAELMFIGDAPEKEDDANGSLLSGGAGKLLTDIIKAMKFNVDQVYITNTIKCSVQNKQLVNEEETVSQCLPYLEREIQLVKPKAIVLLGPVPLKYLLDKAPIGKCRGQWYSYRGIECMPTYSPSYLLRMVPAKRDVWNDMKQVMQKLDVKA